MVNVSARAAEHCDKPIQNIESIHLQPCNALYNSVSDKT